MTETAFREKLSSSVMTWNTEEKMKLVYMKSYMLQLKQLFK